MVVRVVKKLMLAGLSVKTNNANEKKEETAKIMQLWDDYETTGTYGKTFNKNVHSPMYCFYSEYEDGLAGDFKATVAIEVTKPKNAVIIENERYLVFSNEGELPEIVAQTWKEIFEYFENNDKYTRKFNIDFEKYSNKDDIEIYISIN